MVDWQTGWLEHKLDAKRDASDPLHLATAASSSVSLREGRVETLNAPRRKTRLETLARTATAPANTGWAKTDLLPHGLLQSIGSEHVPVLLTGDEHKGTMKRRLDKSASSPNLSSSTSEWRMRSLRENSLSHCVRA